MVKKIDRNLLVIEEPALAVELPDAAAGETFPPGATDGLVDGLGDGGPLEGCSEDGLTTTITGAT